MSIATGGTVGVGGNMASTSIGLGIRPVGGNGVGTARSLARRCLRFGGGCGVTGGNVHRPTHLRSMNSAISAYSSSVNHLRPSRA